MRTSYSFGSNNTATLWALPTAPPDGSMPTIRPLPGSTYTTLNWNSVSVMCSPQLPAARSVHPVDIQSNVRFAERGRIGSRHLTAGAAVMIGLMHEHLLHVRCIRTPTDRMGGACPAAVRALEHDIRMIFGSVDSGGPADLGGGDGAAVTEFVVHRFDGAVGVELDWSYAHRFLPHGFASITTPDVELAPGRKKAVPAAAEVVVRVTPSLVTPNVDGMFALVFPISQADGRVVTVGTIGFFAR